jgi:hypothetical protein
MVFGPPSKTLGYTESKDPDPTKPLHDVGRYAIRTRDDPSWNQTIISDRVVASAVRQSESFATSPIFTLFFPAVVLDVNPLANGNVGYSGALGPLHAIFGARH